MQSMNQRAQAFAEPMKKFWIGTYISREIFGSVEVVPFEKHFLNRCSVTLLKQYRSTMHTY